MEFSSWQIGFLLSRPFIFFRGIDNIALLVEHEDFALLSGGGKRFIFFH